MLGCVEAVLDAYASVSPYHLWRRIAEAPAIRSATREEYSPHAEIDLAALAEQLLKPALAAV
jgi:hypothetical protein